MVDSPPSSSQLRSDAPPDDARLAQVLELCGIATLEIVFDDRGGSSGYRSPEYLQLHGLPTDRQEETHEDWRRRVHPDDVQRAERALFDAMASGASAYRNDYRIIRSDDGSTRWIRARGCFERDTDGRPLRLIGAHMDVTEERLMRAELQHRVRNVLAVVRSITRRTAASSASVEQFSQRLDGRLASFARTQSYLAFPARKIDLEMLLRDELLAHAAGFSDQVAISGPEVRLAPRVAQTLGLTLHELVAAAVESGALEDKDGSVSAAWRVEGTAPDLRLRFEWRERRTSHFNSAEEDDQGLDLLSRALVYELDADVAVDLSGEGLYFAVEFRLPDDRAEFY